MTTEKFQMHTCMVVFIMSVQCLHNVCVSVHKVCMIHIVHTWRMTKKVCETHTFMLVCIMSA
jgi:hypothetical protein